MTFVDPRPIKRLGQNWLRDDQIISKMVAAAELRPTDLVVEIGPGTGAITKHLAKTEAEVIAYEIDQDLVDKLREELHWAKNVQIVEENILAKDLQLPTRTYKVVASLPYYITSPILERLLLAHPIASVIILMIQKEVADKIVATPPDGSYLANFVQLFGNPEIVATVPAAAFYPKPQVDSAILRIKTLPEPRLPHTDLEQMQLLLHAGFHDPRKQLHNSLAHGLHISPTDAKNLLQLAEIDSERRAETLSIQEWVKLYEVVKKA